jgi:hypothetical protein
MEFFVFVMVFYCKVLNYGDEILEIDENLGV